MFIDLKRIRKKFPGRNVELLKTRDASVVCMKEITSDYKPASYIKYPLFYSDSDDASVDVSVAVEDKRDVSVTYVKETPVVRGYDPEYNPNGLVDVSPLVDL